MRMDYTVLLRGYLKSFDEKLSHYIMFTIEECAR